MSAARALAWDAPWCALPESALLVCDERELAQATDAREFESSAGSDEAASPGVASAAPQEAADAEEARAAMRAAQAFLEAGKIGDAVLELRVVERMRPRVADRFALERAELLERLSMPVQACEAFAIAAQSPDRNVAARAEIGGVRCLLEARDKKAERAFQALLSRYAHLPSRHDLEYELALARESWGSPRAAAELLRRIDLDAPASAVAERARVELERLAGQGVHVAPYTFAERITRAERLLYDGPIDQAATEIAALVEQKGGDASLHQRAQELAARVARIQGRFDARDAGASGANADAARRDDSAADGSAESEAERAAAERQIKALRGNKSIERLSAGPLLAVFEIAIAHGLRDECDQVLNAMRTRRGFDPPARFTAAMRASGVASDEPLANLLQTLIDVPRFRLSARYHYARALERLGRFGEAEAQYLKVITSDRSSSPYYSMWADLRLWAMQSQTRESCVPDALSPLAEGEGTGTATEERHAAGRDEAPRDAGDAAAAPSAPSATSLVSAIFDEPTPMPALRGRVLPDYAGAAADSPPPEHADAAEPLTSSEANEAAVADRERAAQATAAAAQAAQLRARVLALLTPIAAEHGDAYPWLLRACDLVELERFEAAADEVNEAYLAYRDATGALRLRSGLFALLTGNAPPRRQVTYALATARRALDRPTRGALSDIASLLGDPGVGVRFGAERFDARPRAYAPLVERAAHTYGLDPNLLFAVMRVESIYNRRIISNAGAVGLMQIMPATGERIAKQLGVEDFDPTELLDPERNIEFSAWYLASLLKRFDGRLPLAIASYNGGPHNVRLWMHRNPPRMPLDAFLERIPFSQTHDYVRRVLAYYAQYRAQQNLPMTRLSVDLPERRPDPLAF